jgi:predicted lipoprotein with Yx(FWY)xxD motif
MKRIVLVVVALVAVVVVGAVAVSAKSPSKSSPAKAAAKAPAKAKKAASIKLRSTKLGKIAVDAHGRTLYLFEKDKHGKSACYGACAVAWPPAVLKGTPTAGSGISKSALGTTRRRGGARQLTLGGHPLYRFIKDKKPGDTEGQDVDAFGAEWYAVHGNGKKVHGHG